MSRLVVILLALLVGLGACRSAAPAASPAGAEGLRVVLVRHAETAPDGTRDPGLSAAGLRRAARLAEAVTGGPLVAVYATEYRRTQETAAPAARQAGLQVTVVPYEAGPLPAYVERLAAAVRRHADGSLPAGATVLVVGHSNTTPALAEALTGASVPAMDEGEYDRVTTVRLGSEGGTLEPSAVY